MVAVQRSFQLSGGRKELRTGKPVLRTARLGIADFLHNLLCLAELPVSGKHLRVACLEHHIIRRKRERLFKTGIRLLEALERY